MLTRFPEFSAIVQVAVVAIAGLGMSASNTVAEDRLQEKHAEPRPSVRMLYIVPSDREPSEEYRDAIEAAIVDLQGWYQTQMDGLTFRLSEPIVEVLRSDKPARWFTDTKNGSIRENWPFNNALAEARHLVGAKHNHPLYTFAIYVDCDNDQGRGGAGVAYLPGDDLLGLVGRHPTQKNKLRWVAGLGHEIGHAFGLPHPADTEKHADALMWAGIYGKYPDAAYLTDEDHVILRASRFFSSDNATTNSTRESNDSRATQPRTEDASP